MPGPGELVVAVEYFSIDPAMRRWIAPTPLRRAGGDWRVMEASAIGRVTASEHPGFAVGEHLYGGFGVQEFARSDGTGVTKLDPSLGPAHRLPRRARHPGADGLLRPARRRPAERGRDGRRLRRGRRRRQRRRPDREDQGLPGDRDRRRAGEVPLDRRELGFDAAIDYKAEDVAGRLGSSRPTASTSSSTTSAARSSTRCWPIWHASPRRPQRRPLAVQRGRDPRAVQLPAADLGAGVDDRLHHARLLRPLREARLELAGWLRDGRLMSREQIIEGGVRAFPDALLELFAGENVGKLIIAV